MARRGGIQRRTVWSPAAEPTRVSMARTATARPRILPRTGRTSTEPATHRTDSDAGRDVAGQLPPGAPVPICVSAQPTCASLRSNCSHSPLPSPFLTSRWHGARALGRVRTLAIRHRGADTPERDHQCGLVPGSANAAAQGHENAARDCAARRRLRTRQARRVAVTTKRVGRRYLVPSRACSHVSA
jgi:hypothetical protein